MEKSHSVQSDDESNTKRQEMETSTSKPESKDPFLSMPPDVLAKIIGYIPIAQWPALELVDKNFRAATLIAWRQLRNVNVDREFVIKPENEETGSTFGKSVKSIVDKLVECSPFLIALRGIDLQVVDSESNSDIVQSLAQFENLESITLGDGKFFTGVRIRQGIPLGNVVDFLESTRSRTSLKEVQLFVDIFQRHGDDDVIIDRFDVSFANGRETQSPLKLEKFSFTSSSDSFFVSLDTMDTTRLTELRVQKTGIEPDQLTNLIERASNLRRIELSFFCCYFPCNSPRLGENKKLLMALASREHLTAIKIGFVYINNVVCDCVDFRSEFIEMLKMIGRRGQLTRLSLEDVKFVDKEEIYSTIRDHIPYLRSIKLHDNILSEESLHNIVGLEELEEFSFGSCVCGAMTGFQWQGATTPSIVKDVAKLPRLKRLALVDPRKDDRENSLKYLVEATSLTDLRIRFDSSSRGDVFEKWTDGLASNLQSLMLWRIDMKDETDADGLARFLEKATQLRVLILNGYITDQTLMAIAESCPKLEVLGLQTGMIDVRHLQDIVDRCPRLKRLGGFEEEIRKKLQFPKYRKIGNVDMNFYKYDFEDDEYD